MTKRFKVFGKFILLGLFVWLVGLALFFLQIFLQVPQKTDSTTDAIVVLTGGQSRIENGLKLFAHGKASHLFISGVHPDVKMHEITSKWKSDVAMPPCCITLGYEATTTHQNAQEVKAFLDKENYSSIRLVTSNFHMNRSLIELKHAIPDIEIIPHPIKQSNAKPSDLWFWIVSLKEYNKTIIRWSALILLPHKDEAAHGDHA